MKVQLSVKASKLSNVAGAFKGTSDPYAVITLMNNDSTSQPKVIGKTEVIKNNLSPDWSKVFLLDYELGLPTTIAVNIFDEVRKSHNVSMGSAIFEIGSIIGAKGSTKAKKMKKGKGTVYVRVEKVKGSGSLRLKMSGIKLKNVEGFMKKSDPFYELAKKDYGDKGTEWNVVHRSKEVKDNLSPNWAEDNLDLSTLCGGDLDHPIRISVYDYESDGKHVPMGHVETTVNGIVAAKRSGGFTLRTRKGQTGKLVVHTAMLSGVEEERSMENEMAEVSISTPAPSAPAFVPMPPPSSKPSFLDYLQGGCEINLSVAIDFTGSNGDPRKPGTLHYLSGGGVLNDYEKAVKAIGGILSNYDSDKKFPVWGFGAKYGGVVRHCFQCGTQPEADGVDGVLEAYHATFRSGLIMSGPTDITEVIGTAAAFARSGQEAASQMGQQKYTILLILTDGAVTDVSKTIAVLDQVNDAPLSIVIVGIGNADFSAMRFLDDRQTGKPDIVDFVQFNNHRHNPDSLTAATLNEVPEQLVAYFTRNGIQPLAPVQSGDDEIVIEPEEEEFDLSVDMPGDDGEIVVTGMGQYVPPRVY